MAGQSTNVRQPYRHASELFHKSQGAIQEEGSRASELQDGQGLTMQWRFKTLSSGISGTVKQVVVDGITYTATFVPKQKDDRSYWDVRDDVPESRPWMELNW